MLLILTVVAIIIFFLPFIYFAGGTSLEEERMRVRFSLLRNGSGGLSSGEEITLKSVEQQSSGWTATIVRLTAWLHLSELILQANGQQTPWQVLRLTGILVVSTILISTFLTHQYVMVLLLGAGAGCGPWLFLKLRAKQRLAAMNEVLPQVLEMMSRAMRAGHSLAAALSIVAEEADEPARSAFGEVFQKQKFGFPLRDALIELVRCYPSNDLKVLVTAILVQRDTGGNLVQILERTSMVVRERLKLQGDIRVHTAQGRLTGWILCLLPVLMLTALLITNPSYPKVLLDDPVGRKLLYGGAALLACGAYAIQRIVKTIEL